MNDETRRPVEGALEGDSLLGILRDLAAREATGILTVQSDRDILAISLERGAIVGADALNETLEEGLGRAFIDEGLLTKPEFADVLDRVHVERLRLADVLLEEELLSRRDYLAAVRRYTLELIDRACKWDESDFKFYGGDEVSYEEGFEAIPAGELTPEARADEATVPERSLEAEILEEWEESPVGAEPRSPVASTAAVPRPERSAPPAPAAWVLARLEDVSGWLGWLAPVLVFVLLAGVVVWRPNSVVYPFFWLEPERLELEGERRASVYQQIDRAAKTFFLLEGRFPDDLHTLVVRGLLAPDDIVDARGRILTYAPGDRGYVIRATGADGTDLGVNKLEAIAGDFLLDPEFVMRDPRTDTVPLVLLD
ncbi:MAG: hypothetical protein R3244_03225 [Thermoanaerobaculia bacterium]|nr:hypothetical protein [Thermoanaerobaculia bacterium]